VRHSLLLWVAVEHEALARPSLDDEPDAAISTACTLEV